MAGIAGYYLEFLDEPGCVFGGLELVSPAVDLDGRNSRSNPNRWIQSECLRKPW